VSLLTSDWEVATLADLGGRVTSGSRGWAAHYADHGSLFVRITNLRRDRIRLDLRSCRFVDIDPNDVEARRTQLEAGDLLVSITADIGIIGYVDESLPSPAYINQHIARVRLDRRLADSRFIAYYLASWEPQRHFVGATDTGAKAGMNLSTVAALSTAVPPLPEQRRIAEALRDVDDLIDALERRIVKKQAIRRGVMQQLLSGRTRLPGFDALWSHEALGTVGTVSMGQSPLGSSYNTSGRGIPLVQGNADIKDRRTIERIWTTAPTRRCKVDDVVLTVRAPVGYTALATSEACLGRGVCSVAAGRDTRYLYHALVYAEPRWAVYEQGSTFTAVNSNEVRSFTIPWPTDPGERKAIGDVLDNVDAEVRLLQIRLVKAQETRQGMQQELLTGRTRLPIGEAAV
jgi:type I restriction enzyme, S subunit